MKSNWFWPIMYICHTRALQVLYMLEITQKYPAVI